MKKTLTKLIFMGLLSMFFKSNAQEISSIYDLTFTSITGEKVSLEMYKGKYILFVNVASECGFTSQYKGLEKLAETYKDKLVVLGFPCDQFGGQEPGNSQEIMNFCKDARRRSFCRSRHILKRRIYRPKSLLIEPITSLGKGDTVLHFRFQKRLKLKERISMKYILG